MDRDGALERRFEKRTRFRPLSYAAEINDDGLVFGAGTVLARMTRDSFGSPTLALDADRLSALLAVVRGRPVPPDQLRHIESASVHWRRGEKALANICLAFAKIPRLEGRSDAYRLFLAEELLDSGTSPSALMKALGLDAPLQKYDPNQPRVAAGSGRTSGRWTSDGRGAVAPSPTRNAPMLGLLAAGRTRTLADALFRAGPGAGEFLAALGRFAIRLSGASSVLGAIFIPSRNSVVSEGAVADAPDLSYSWNKDEGSLRLYRQDVTGRRVVAAARLGRDGIFYHEGTTCRSGASSTEASSSIRLRSTPLKGDAPAPAPTSRSFVRNPKKTRRMAPRNIPKPIRADQPP